MKPSLPIAAALLAALTGCMWVTPSPEAMNADIAVLDAAGVKNCEQLAANQLTVADHLGGLQRLPEDVEHDLRTMAINQAATVGADRVAPLSELQGGTQTWGIYRCGAASKGTTKAPGASSGIKTLPYTPPR